jgi:hypothetical protein
MKLDLGDSQSRRNRMGFALLFTGLVMLLWAWGSYVYRASVSGGVDAAPSEGPTTVPDQTAVLRSLPLTLMVGLLLVLVFLFGSYALIRLARRLREAAERRPIIPTPSNDVWAKHRPPKGDEDAS